MTNILRKSAERKNFNTLFLKIFRLNNKQKNSDSGSESSDVQSHIPQPPLGSAPPAADAVDSSQESGVGENVERNTGSMHKSESRVGVVAINLCGIAFWLPAKVLFECALLATTSVVGSVNEESKKREFSLPTTMSFLMSVAAGASSAYISNILASFGLPSEDEIASYVQMGVTGAAVTFGALSYILSRLQCGWCNNCRCWASASFSPNSQLSSTVSKRHNELTFTATI